MSSESLADRPLASPLTPKERLEAIEADLDRLQELLEHLWLERHLLYSAIREVKTAKRNIELVKARLGGNAT